LWDALQEVREQFGGGMVAAYQTTPSAQVPGAVDIEFSTSAHEWNVTLFIQAVATTPLTTVTLKVAASEVAVISPNQVPHPEGLVRSSHSSNSDCVGSFRQFAAWSSADASETVSQLSEVVVRVPGHLGVGGVRYVISNVIVG
jgi:hypothetical protein